MAIVYAPTRSVTEGVARALAAAGHRAAPYHAGLTAARRAAMLDAFLGDRLDVIVATCAFGMGIDKPTVRLVVHWTLPPTPEAYYQEAGRAGRDGEFARCVLLWRPGDAALHRRQLDVTFPPRRAAGADLARGQPRRCAGERAGVGGAAAAGAAARRGPVDWEPVARRRQRAEARLRGDGAVRRRAPHAGGGRWSATSVSAWRGAPGCDRCRNEPAARPLLPAVAARLTRLRQALGGKAGPWGGCLLEPDVLLRLARNPPTTPAHSPTCRAWGRRSPSGTAPSYLARWTFRAEANGVQRGEKKCRTVESAAAERALEEWRAAVAREMGVPAYVVLGDSALAQLASGTRSGAHLGRRQTSAPVRPPLPCEIRCRAAAPARPAGPLGGHFPFDASPLRSMSSTIFFADPSPRPRVSAFTMNRSPTSTTISLLPSLFHFSNAG